MKMAYIPSGRAGKGNEPQAPDHRLVTQGIWTILRQMDTKVVREGTIL